MDQYNILLAFAAGVVFILMLQEYMERRKATKKLKKREKVERVISRATPREDFARPKTKVPSFSRELVSDEDIRKITGQNPELAPTS